MQKVRGIGGVFFKSKDPKALAKWYAEHLGVELSPWGGAKFEGAGVTAWNTFAADTTYFGEGPQPFMINYRVDDLAAMLAQLKALGDVFDDKIDDSEYGKFAWVTDPDGNRVELWQPPG